MLTVHSSDKKTYYLNTPVTGFCYDKNLNILYFSLSNSVKTTTLYTLKENYIGSFAKQNLIKEDFIYDVPYKLFSNNEGLWALAENTNAPDSTLLLHIKDSEGNFIEEKKESSKITISGNWLSTQDYLFKDNFILYLNETKTKILKYADGKIQNVSKYEPHKSLYDKKDLEKVCNILLQEVKESEYWISEIKNMPVIGIVVFAVFCWLFLDLFSRFACNSY